jgi:hypothetical protein
MAMEPVRGGGGGRGPSLQAASRQRHGRFKAWLLSLAPRLGDLRMHSEPHLLPAWRSGLRVLLRGGPGGLRSRLSWRSGLPFLLGEGDRLRSRLLSGESSLRRGGDLLRGDLESSRPLRRGGGDLDLEGDLPIRNCGTRGRDHAHEGRVQSRVEEEIHRGSASSKAQQDSTMRGGRSLLALCALLVAGRCVAHFHGPLPLSGL